MSAEREILVAVDGGAHGWDALAWAAAEAAASERTLHIVHVVGWPTAASTLIQVPDESAALAAQAAGDAIVDEAVRHVQKVVPGLRIVTRLEVEPRPGRAILRAARNASLIVLGRRRDGRALRSRFGRSVASYVARRASAPVVIAGLADRGGPSAGRIAVVIDSRGDVFDVLSLAFEAAQRRGIGVTVLHAGSGRTADAGRTVTALIAAFRGAFTDIDVSEESVPAPVGPMLSAASQGAALLVLGGRSARHVRRGPLTEVSRKVAEAVRTPVVIVPTVNAA
jgi:nucleotide-binding universal stress UspA family protein